MVQVDWNGRELALMGVELEHQCCCYDVVGLDVINGFFLGFLDLTGLETCLELGRNHMRLICHNVTGVYISRIKNQKSRISDSLDISLDHHLIRRMNLLQVVGVGDHDENKHLSSMKSQRSISRSKIVECK